MLGPRTPLVLLSLMGSTALACAALSAGPTQASRRSSSLYDLPWVFHDEADHPVRFADWSGTPLLVAPFYTSCQLRCPRTIDKLREVEATLARAGRPATILLVTLDPETDTPARLKAYKASRSLPASWHLLAGTRREAAELSRRFGVHPAYDDGHIDHEVRVAVVDARGHVVRVLAGWGFDDRAAMP
jgi:protein SCO1/2